MIDSKLPSKPLAGKCPHCEKEGTLSEAVVNDSFQHGVNGVVAELVASVPVIGCSACEETWTDYRAEGIKERMITELFGEQPPVKVKLDAFHYHEVLHTASLMNHMMEDFINSHPVTLQDLEVKSAADAATEALGDLYQAIGTARFTFMEKENVQPDQGNQS